VDFRRVLLLIHFSFVPLYLTKAILIIPFCRRRPKKNRVKPLWVGLKYGKIAAGLEIVHGEN
jgi:hypothetical protein